MVTHSKIPPEAKRVFKGVIFDVYEWKQKRFDGSLGNWEMLRRPDTAIVFPVTPDCKIMVTETYQPNRSVKIGCPGGRVDAGETPAQAARRELLEETGYKAATLKKWITYSPSAKIEHRVHCFIGYDCVKVREPLKDPGEKNKSRFVSFDEFVKLYLDGVIRFLEIENIILRAKLEQKKMKELRKLFLG